MTSLRAFAFATTAGLLLLAGCSVIASFDGLAGSAIDGDATVAGDGGPEMVRDGATASNDGAIAANDAGTLGDAMPSLDWGMVTIVQSKRSTGKPGVDLDQATKQGTLLVVMCPDAKPPTPSGIAPQWQMMKSSYGGAIVIWPANPGGITHFTINDANNDLFFLEMSGVPVDVTLSEVVDTGPKDGGTTTESLSAPTSAGPHAIALLYIDTSSGTSASADMSWTTLGTDTNNDYAWFRLNPTAPFGATVTFSPLCPAQMMMMQVGDGK